MTMKDAFNLKALFPSYDQTNFLQYNYIGDQIILCVFTIFISIAGLVGNGNIIWLLGFRIKKKPFATYILNLAVADFGSLLFSLPLAMRFGLSFFHGNAEFLSFLSMLSISPFLAMCNSRHLLLAAISIDGWVSAVFPNWYKRHRSPVLSTTLCAFIWALSFGIGVPLFLFLMDLTPHDYVLALLLGQIVMFLICLLLVIISTLTLFIKVCLKRCQCGNLLKVILLILLSHVLYIILTFALFILFSKILVASLGLWNSLKGSINPLIYFFVGRQNGGKFQERMKVVLQRVFKEERDARMELQPRTQTVSRCRH